MPNGKNERRQTKIAEFQRQFDLLSQKLALLQKERIIETYPARIFQLEKDIETIEAERQQLEATLEALEIEPFMASTFRSGRHVRMEQPQDVEAASQVDSTEKFSIVPNPFGDVGRIETSDRFFDREDLLRRIFEELDKGSNLSLVGASQVGKSSLLAMICALGPERMARPPDGFAYFSLEWVDDEADFYETLCAELHVANCRGGKLRRALSGKRYVLCLDEIEKMAWDGFTANVRSHLRGLADGSAAPLRLVIASRSPLDQLFPDSPELTSPLAGICQKMDVGPFPPDVARAFLLHRLTGAGVTFPEAVINRLIDETGGHPGKLQRVAALLFE